MTHGRPVPKFERLLRKSDHLRRLIAEARRGGSFAWPPRTRRVVRGQAEDLFGWRYPLQFWRAPSFFTYAASAQAFALFPCASFSWIASPMRKPQLDLEEHRR